MIRNNIIIKNLLILILSMILVGCGTLATSLTNKVENLTDPYNIVYSNLLFSKDEKILYFIVTQEPITHHTSGGMFGLSVPMQYTLIHPNKLSIHKLFKVELDNDTVKLLHTWEEKPYKKNNDDDNRQRLFETICLLGDWEIYDVQGRVININDFKQRFISQEESVLVKACDYDSYSGAIDEKYNLSIIAPGPKKYMLSLPISNGNVALFPPVLSRGRYDNIFLSPDHKKLTFFIINDDTKREYDKKEEKEKDIYILYAKYVCIANIDGSGLKLIKLPEGI